LLGIYTAAGKARKYDEARVTRSGGEKRLPQTEVQHRMRWSVMPTIVAAVGREAGACVRACARR